MFYLQKSVIGNKKSQGGYSLVELIFVLAIILVLSILVITAYNTSDDTQQAAEEVENTTKLAAAIRMMFNSQGSYTGLANTVLLKSVAFPENMRINGSTTLIKHSWDDNGVTVLPRTVNYAGDHFVIRYNGVPEKACATMVPSAYRHYVQVRVNGTVITGAAAGVGSCAANSTIEFVGR